MSGDRRYEYTAIPSQESEETATPPQPYAPSHGKGKLRQILAVVALLTASVTLFMTSYG